MQEEVTEKTIALCIKGGKITAQILKAALLKLLSKMEKKKQQAKGEKSQCEKSGKQSIKSLQKSGAQITNIVVTDNNIKSFDRFAAQCGGRMAPLYPCLTALQCAHPRKSLAGIRAKGCASLLDGTDGRVLAREMGEVQFTDYGLSGICIMQLSGLLAPGRGPKQPVIALDLFPALSEAKLSALFARRAGLLCFLPLS